MDALLTETWLHGLDALPAIDDASASLCRERARDLGRDLGLGVEVVEGLALAASEIVHNQLRHARRGQVALRPIARGDVPGIEIVAADQGPGIADPRAALAGPGPSPRSLGAGLSGARRMVHEMDLDVRWGQGTLIRARAFAAPVPRRREVGILGRALPGEAVSGDHAVFVREGDVLLCAVVDGIGHGPPAEHAAGEAALVVLSSPGSSPAALLEAADRALSGTRGAVMAVDRFDEALGTLEHASVGNVTARLDGFKRTHSLVTTSSTLGRRRQKAHVAAETTDAPAGHALVVFTDGLGSRATLLETPDMLREHPIVAAQHLMETFGRTTDDALVLVAR